MDGDAAPDSAASGHPAKMPRTGKDAGSQPTSSQPTSSGPCAAPSGQLNSISSLTGKEREVVEGKQLHCVNIVQLQESVSYLGAGTTKVEGLKHALAMHEIVMAHRLVIRNGQPMQRKPQSLSSSAPAEEFDLGEGQRKEWTFESSSMQALLDSPRMLIQDFVMKLADNLGLSKSTLRALVIDMDVQEGAQGPAAAERLHLSMPPDAKGAVIIAPLNRSMDILVALRSHLFSKQ